MANAKIDENDVKSLLAVSSADGKTPVVLYADPVSHRLFVDIPGGSGTVTSVSVVTANGFAGSVADPTTTPAITLSTTVTGILKGNGTAISAASAGTDYQAPITLTTTGSSGAATFIANTLNIPDYSSASFGLTVGTTTISSGTNGRILYDNSGVLGELATTGSGSVVLATSPTLITPTLGVATATSINKVTITAPATGSTLTIADGKTLTANGNTTLGLGGIVLDNSGGLIVSASKVLTVSNSLTLAGTDGKTLTISNNGTLSGGDGFTLAIAASKTLTVSNSLTLAGTDSTTMTFPSTNATIARTDAAQTFTGIQTIPQILNTPATITVSSNAGTVTRSNRINNFTNSSAATMTITMSTTGATDGDMIMVVILDASAVAQTITWVNTENSTVSAPTTSNGSTTLPLTVGFKWNASTSKWRCLFSV